jgi:type II secretory ATPase GspE/PulE/Tfp pilus assembly ATPase PilB-like protein
LVRVLCPKCKVRYKANPEMLRKANLPADIKYFYRPPEPGERRPGEVNDELAGPCRHCRGAGYRGRTGVFELLIMNDRIRELISSNVNLATFQQEAVRGGMKPLKEDALRHVMEGSTFIKEYLRVFES